MDLILIGNHGMNPMHAMIIGKDLRLEQILIQNLKQVFHEKEFTGLLSRIIQHELDHLWSIPQSSRHHTYQP